MLLNLEAKLDQLNELLKTKKFKECEILAEQLLAETSDESIKCRIESYLAECLRESGRLEDSKILYSKCLIIARRENIKDLIFFICFNLGTIELVEYNNATLAIELYLEALELIEQDKNNTAFRDEYEALCYLLGGAYYELNNYIAASEFFLKALKYEESEHFKIDIFERLGFCFYSLNDISNAISYYIKVLELLNSEEEKFGIIVEELTFIYQQKFNVELTLDQILKHEISQKKGFKMLKNCFSFEYYNVLRIITKYSQTFPKQGIINRFFAILERSFIYELKSLSLVALAILITEEDTFYVSRLGKLDLRETNKFWLRKKNDLLQSQVTQTLEEIQKTKKL